MTIQKKIKNISTQAQSKKTAEDEKIIFHIDVNSAFLSWSAVKKLREEPESVDLRTIPSVVGGDPGSRHGVVTAKSLPAKKYGIRTADTIASALQRCPSLVIVPSDFQTYRAYSRAFLDILHEYTPLVEQASIDEAYLDATELCRIPEEHGTAPREQALTLAARIRQEIRERLGFTVNVGISSNRLLAKMASDFEKPDKTHTLFPEEVPAKMWPLPIGSLYGCGGRTSERLRSLGIRTIGDAANAPLQILTDNLGDKSGKYIHSAANGRGRAAISPVRESAKSYSNEWTTSSDIRQETYDSEFLPLLQHLCDKVSGRLQRDNVYGRTVVVTVKTDEFQRRSAQKRLQDPSNSAEILYQAAVSLSDKLLLGEHGLFAEGAGIRLVGAGVTDLDDGSFRQMSLLDWEPEETALPEFSAPRHPQPSESGLPQAAPAAGLSQPSDSRHPQSSESGLPQAAPAAELSQPSAPRHSQASESGLSQTAPAAELSQPSDSRHPQSSESVLPQVVPAPGLLETAPEQPQDAPVDPAGSPPSSPGTPAASRAERLRRMEEQINRRFGAGTVRKGNP